jgi:hypothetical protein
MGTIFEPQLVLTKNKEEQVKVLEGDDHVKAICDYQSKIED